MVNSGPFVSDHFRNCSKLLSGAPIHLFGPKQFPLPIALALFWYFPSPSTLSWVDLQYNNHNVKKLKPKKHFHLLSTENEIDAPTTNL